jgi:hypothetical protein
MSEPVHKPRAREADVGLLLEGTYPYVAGGVSSWVHQIINGFPDITFAICFLGSRRQDYSDMKFKLPPTWCTSRSTTSTNPMAHRPSHRSAAIRR